MHERLDQQRTGSVYLDRPVATRDRPRGSRPRRAGRHTIATVLLFLGLSALGMSVVSVGLQSVVLDADPWLDAFDDTLDDPVARPELEREVANAIARGLVGEELTEVAAIYGLDVVSESERIAGPVLDDPTVRSELRALLEESHRRLLVEPSEAPADLAPLSSAVLAVIERESPRLAEIVPADTALWTVDADTFPDLRWTTELADRFRSALPIGAVLVALAVLLHPHRHRTASWVGRALLVLGLVAALAAVGLPYLVGGITGWTTAEIAVRAMTLRLLAPAAIAGIAGMGLVSVGAFMGHRANGRVADEGAAAALGYDEPPLWPSPTSRQLDLAQRGLVDANQTLTNL